MGGSSGYRRKRISWSFVKKTLSTLSRISRRTSPCTHWQMSLKPCSHRTLSFLISSYLIWVDLNRTGQRTSCPVKFISFQFRPDGQTNTKLQTPLINLLTHRLPPAWLTKLPSVKLSKKTIRLSWTMYTWCERESLTCQRRPGGVDGARPTPELCPWRIHGATKLNFVGDTAHRSREHDEGRVSRRDRLSRDSTVRRLGVYGVLIKRGPAGGRAAGSPSPVRPLDARINPNHRRRRRTVVADRLRPPLVMVESNFFVYRILSYRTVGHLRCQYSAPSTDLLNILSRLITSSTAAVAPSVGSVFVAIWRHSAILFDQRITLFEPDLCLKSSIFYVKKLSSMNRF